MDYGAIDEQLVRLPPEIMPAAARFVLLKIDNMRGLDLNLFDFDHDLTWAALMMAPDGKVLGRFGGRDADTPGKYHSLRGLRYSLEHAWDQFQRKDQTTPAPARPVKRAEDYPAARRLDAKACIHCHNVNEFRREQRIQAGIWSKDLEWVFPEPENLGLSLAIDQGNKVRELRPGGHAAKAGMQPGDVLRLIDGRPVASVADVQYALNLIPQMARVSLTWQRGSQKYAADIDLPAGWRRTDISWRWSLKSLAPGPQVHGEDLTAAERAKLDLTSSQLAFRQGAFVPKAAQQAGVRIGDVIVGIDGKRLDMTVRQFEAYMRLNYKAGDIAKYDIVRGHEKLQIAVPLSD